MEDESQARAQSLRSVAIGSLRLFVRLCAISVTVAMLYAMAWNAAGPSWSGLFAGAFHFAALFISTFWVHLGVTALLVAGAAGMLRLRWFAATSLIVGLIPTLPLLLGLVIGRAEAAHTNPADDLHVMSANLLYSVEELAPFFAQVERRSPDVLLLQEVHTDRVSAIASELADDYPHSFIWPQHGAFGQAVFSRYPFVGSPDGEPRIEMVSGDPKRRWEVGHAVATIDIQGFHVDLMNVHLLPPSGFNLASAQNLMAMKLANIADEMSSDASILGGDFNAAERALPVSRFRDKGYTSVHLESGRGLGATWPRKGRLSHVPGIRIDHMLYRGDRLRLLDQGVGDDFGSDHRPVWASFELIKER